MNIIPLTAHDERKQQFIIQFASEIESAYQNSSFNMAELAHNLSITESELMNKTEQYFHITPDSYLREFRLDQAIELMREGMLIHNIPKYTGFSDQNNFNKSFMKRFNTEPSNFINSIYSAQNII